MKKVDYIKYSQDDRENAVFVKFEDGKSTEGFLIADRGDEVLKDVVDKGLSKEEVANFLYEPTEDYSMQNVTAEEYDQILKEYSKAFKVEQLKKRGAEIKQRRVTENEVKDPLAEKAKLLKEAQVTGGYDNPEEAPYDYEPTKSKDKQEVHDINAQRRANAYKWLLEKKERNHN